MGERHVPVGDPQLGGARGDRAGNVEPRCLTVGATPGLRWHDVTVRRAAGQAPSLDISGTIAPRSAELGITHWHVSLSHDGGLASAVVIGERL